MQRLVAGDCLHLQACFSALQQSVTAGNSSVSATIISFVCHRTSSAIEGRICLKSHARIRCRDACKRGLNPWRAISLFAKGTP